MSGNRVRITLKVFFVVALLNIVGVGPAAGQESNVEIDIRLSDFIFGEPGEVHRVGMLEVGEGSELGDSVPERAKCRVSVETQNGTSIHEGNDLIVRSGSDVVTFSGVENEGNKISNFSETMILGDKIVAHLRLGESGTSSMGFELSFDCEPVEFAPPPTARVKPKVQTPTTTDSGSQTTLAPTTAPKAASSASSITRPMPPVPQPVEVLAQTKPAQALAGEPTYTG